MNIYIYTRQKAHGVRVIVENLKDAFIRKGVRCEIISTLSGRVKEDVIIPYSVKEANEVIDKGYDCKIVFCADAITLGYLNKIKHYFKVGHIFNYDFFYSIYAYLKYIPLERRMLKKFEKCIFVSPEDISYAQKRFAISSDKFLYAPNGISLPKQIKHNSAKKFRIGILSPWVSKQITEESKWFINKYFKRFSKSNNNVELVLAGRGSRINQFVGRKNVQVIGEVDSLEDFFSNIDVMISSNPKGCGILNRILDSFSYHTPVLGVPGSFSGFPDGKNCYYVFENYSQFCDIVKKLASDHEALKNTANRAYMYIKKFHNWESIYDELIEKLLGDIIKKNNIDN